MPQARAAGARHPKLLSRVHGSDACWWGHTPPCPAIKSEHACDGQLVYSAQSIRGGSWVRMDQRPSDALMKAWVARPGQFHPDPR